jgi:hypothetical protein
MTCSRPILNTPAVPDFFVPHLNLSDTINSHIIESEIEGGVYLNHLIPGEVLEIETGDWTCRLEYLGDNRAFVSGHARFCPKPVEVTVCGSTWGGSLLKQHFIGRGMHLEFIHPVHHRILTARIAEIRSAPV